MFCMGDEAMKRIVAVTFDDGTEAMVADMQALVQYVEVFRLQQGLRELATDPNIDWAARGEQLDKWNADRLEKKRAIRATRSKPRGRAKDVTPEKARETLDRIVADRLTGWEASKAAAKELGISKRTLNRRIKKSAP